jgi:hypothetical protein
MHRLRILAVVVLMCVAALAGCTDDSPKKASSSSSSTPSKSASKSSSASPSVTPTPSALTETASPTDPPTESQGPSFPHDRTEAASLHLAYLESSVAKSADEKAIVAAWMSFWQGAADTFYLYKPTDQFLAVARGKAKSDILDYANDLKSKQRRVVGWSKDNVNKITIKGNTATVRDCTENYTYTVDQEIEPLTRPTPWYDVTGTLKKEAGGWRVTAQKSKDKLKSCLS